MRFPWRLRELVSNAGTPPPSGGGNLPDACPTYQRRLKLLRNDTSLQEFRPFSKQFIPGNVKRPSTLIAEDHSSTRRY